MIDEELTAIPFERMTKAELRAMKRRAKQHVKKLQDSIKNLEKNIKDIDKELTK